MTSIISFDDAVKRAAESNVRPSNAWRAVASHITAVPDPVYPFDPVVLKAIHEFDQDVIPVWVKVVYRASTGGTRDFGWHALASQRWNPKNRAEPWVQKLMLPASGPIVRPHHIDLHIKDGKKRKPFGLTGYGAYLPFDWRVYGILRDMFGEYKLRDIMAIDKKQDELKLERTAKRDEEHEYRANHGMHIVRKHIENIDQDDLKRLAAKATESPARTPMVVVP